MCLRWARKSEHWNTEGLDWQKSKAGSCYFMEMGRSVMAAAGKIGGRLGILRRHYLVDFEMLVLRDVLFYFILFFSLMKVCYIPCAMGNSVAIPHDKIAISHHH